MEACLYETDGDNSVRCNLCSHRCRIKEGLRGICNVRENRNGVLETRVYDKLIAQHVDPIEKKPLFHVLPGTLSYSIATVGCNFKCRFCQNADIAQMPSDRKGLIVGNRITPEEIVQAAQKHNCKSIAYTYTEPTVYFELAYETAGLAHQAGIMNVFVTNGYMSAEAIQMVRPRLDAANVDLKAFNEDFYKSYCGARLSHVLNTLVQLKSSDVFIEVTTLLIPGLNDDPAELKGLAGFLAGSLGPETPWHISRFHPTYRLTDRPPTPVETLLLAREIGMAAGLKYVYLGNVPGEDGENTYCYQCGKLLIDRWGYHINKNDVENGRCKFCQTTIHGIGM